MGLRDILTGRSRVQGPATDRLFAISTAYVTLQAQYGIEPAGTAAIVFQALATSDFESTLSETEAVVKATGAESGTQVRSQQDTYGYRWMVLSNAPGQVSVEDLTVALNAVATSIEGAGYGERLLCAVFAFRDTRAGGAGAGAAVQSDGDGAPAGGAGEGSARASGQPVYFIYNYKRGYWYPFVPAAGSEQRATERELQLKAQLGSDLPIEPDLERWFPLWGIPI